MFRPNLLKMPIEPSDFFGTTDLDPTTENVLILTGDNASGKSFLRRIITNNCIKDNIKIMSISHERRVAPDFTRAFIYGDENSESTGAITLRSIHVLFRNSITWDFPHVILIDEPEIGLSDETQLGLAKYLKEEIKNLTYHMVQIVIITHSKYIVDELSKINHVYFHVRNKYKTSQEYVDRKIISVEPQQLEDIARANFHIINKMLSDHKKNKEKSA